jgi:hypothetical protein
MGDTRDTLGDAKRDDGRQEWETSGDNGRHQETQRETMGDIREIHGR